ncbi:alpha/beta hydrolase [Paroceanicella profunda]|uniref:Alpha/beta hydrolase n=1 Tax=Paroceanicella profunda TaxID=2579971 RepID=A0A5B8FUG9_9RHOB|nr:alpha/beta hydrolase [Paroceanicella profunda]QDL90720.1 alpha/beta hydrolase [Paroceanicella profunda]
MAEVAPFDSALAEAPEGTRARFVSAPGFGWPRPPGAQVRLRFAVTQPGARGTALIFPGRTEYAEKYGRVMAALAARGFGSVVIDWRGQGLSTRPHNRTDLGHVADFAAYQADLAAVLAAPEVASLPGPRILLAHSMGGCIALRALLSGLEVRAAVLSAPMWGFDIPLSAARSARLVARLMCAVGRSRRHLRAGERDYYALTQPFEDNLLTSDPAHYAWLRAHLTKRPELGLGGVSWGWLNRAFREIDAVARRDTPPVPMVTFLGSEEHIVSPEAIRARMARTPTGRLVTLQGGRHEAWMERPELQEICWAETDRLLIAQGLLPG